nr:MAG TPA: RNA polymerase sigma factor [Caudoviricetes sp.]
MRPFRNQTLFCGGAFRLFSFSGGKEHTVKVRYNDPYGSPFELIIPDGEPEAIKEIIEYLNENARLIRNAERREAYHTLYHLEALDYEGNSIAYLDTPEHIVIQKEEAEHIRNTLTLLTETQQRRLWMLSENMTLCEIAAVEGASAGAVKESLDAAKKKFQNNF